MVSIAFVLTALAFVAVPGTGVLLTVTAGVVRGARAGVITAAGCTLGILPHLIAALTGTVALLQVSGLAFETLKVLGIGYLLVLAVVTWRDRRPLSLATSPAPVSWVRMAGAAVGANLLNPKLTLFFFAFLPQFVPLNTRNPLPILLELGGIFMAMTFVVFVIYGIAASLARRRLLDKPQAVRRLRQAFAVCFVALGIKLATETR